MRFYFSVRIELAHLLSLAGRGFSIDQLSILPHFVFSRNLHASTQLNLENKS